MNTRRTLSIVSVLAVAVAVVLAGCAAPTATTAPTGSNDPSATSGPLTGTVLAVGSSALQPLAQKAAELFMVAHSGVTVTVQGGGSGTGLTQVSTGNADIGNSDLYAEDKLDAATAATLVDHKVCVVGFAAVVHKDVAVTDLTQAQLIDIFTGRITNWKDVGGADEAIVLINRPASSGTRATFKKHALAGADEATGVALTEDSSGTVRSTVAGTPGAISYLALSYLDGSVNALSLDGNAANPENIASGKYPVWSYEHMYTKGEPAGAVKAFLDYLAGDVFKSSISDLGYIPVSDMKVSR